MVAVLDGSDIAATPPALASARLRSPTASADRVKTRPAAVTVHRGQQRPERKQCHLSPSKMDADGAAAGLRKVAASRTGAEPRTLPSLPRTLQKSRRPVRSRHMSSGQLVTLLTVLVTVWLSIMSSSLATDVMPTPSSSSSATGASGDGAASTSNVQDQEQQQCSSSSPGETDSSHVTVNASELGWECQTCCTSLRMPDTPPDMSPGCEFKYECAEPDCSRIPSVYYEARLVSGNGRCAVNNTFGSCRPQEYYIIGQKLKRNRRTGLVRLKSVQIPVVVGYTCKLD
ncbi:uncharacterized protein LOC135828533 [Sycon ciliatum]|uniref:uncharacterized protein LOC135828533 n=1 Tax=Sycon ciliatum TaxID=27933 RepID=UPI0031F6AE9B